MKRSILPTLVLSTAFLASCGGNDSSTGTDDEVGTEDTTGDGDGDGESGTESSTGDGDGDGDTTGDGDGDGDTTGDGDGDGDTTGDTTEGDTTEGDTTEGDTTEGGGVCGNAILEVNEECDDGNNLDNDGCLADCTNASCGDGHVNLGVEACDDGVNDGSYGGCAAGCAALGPYCGDGEIDGPEECDDENPNLDDGCQDDCVIPASCLTLLTYDDALEDGEYLIAPDGYMGAPFAVWCDMTSDGGGYTFLKIDEGNQANAAQAEAECATFGMQLWIPRSVDHKTSGWTIANDANIGDGGNPDYMRILGIYPDFDGATCANQGMNSGNVNCGWGASDDGPWYVHDVNNISEPNGDNSTTGSMYYQWQGNGDIQWHNDIGGAGYTSQYFMCDVGDKQP